MKGLFLCGCVMWVTLAVELANPSRLPHGSLLLPIICGCLFWLRSTMGLILPGTMLLLDWIARPSFLPLCPMLVPMLAVVCLAPSTRSAEYSTGRSWLRVPAPLQLPLLTLVSVILQSLGSLLPEQWLSLPAQASAVLENLKMVLIIALPVSAVISLTIRMADEFGMRRVFSQG
jgi:hypothetical protein